SKSGRQAISGDIFIDATGDGDIFAKAGIPFEKGRLKDGLTQSMGLMFRLGNVNKKPPGKEIIDLARKAIEDGSLPAYRVSFGSQGSTIRENEVSVNVTRIPGDGTNIYDLTNAEIRGRKDVKTIVKFFRENIPGYENCYLISTGVIGVRETRRLVGEYIFTREDVLEGRKFKDVIARGAWGIDIHSPEGKPEDLTQWPEEGISYDIPYRCLLPKRIDNLIVAGRCISATHEAMASLRVMPTCMAMGQAAGTAAALSMKEETALSSLDVRKLQKVLREQGANLG
ncbi:MAG: FAD-dependent oxidoreductase, partial [Candidatus Omnitrophica bacterium]|nr:FAD-dependent oxidoreductase [Candidatus Omnitrophota bacterium]